MLDVLIMLKRKFRSLILSKNVMFISSLVVLIFMVIPLVIIDISWVFMKVINIGISDSIQLIGNSLSITIGAFVSISIISLQNKMKSKDEKGDIKRYIEISLKEEIKNNKETFNDSYNKSFNCKYTLHTKFTTIRWQVVQQQLHKLIDDNSYHDYIDSITNLYYWIERVNRYVGVNNIYFERRKKLLNKLSEAFARVEEAHSKSSFLAEK